METHEGGHVPLLQSRAVTLAESHSRGEDTRGLPRLDLLTLVIAAEAMTTLDGDTVDARIPSLFRGADVMITFCGWPEKAAVGRKRAESEGLILQRPSYY